MHLHWCKNFLLGDFVIRRFRPGGDFVRGDFVLIPGDMAVFFVKISGPLLEEEIPLCQYMFRFSQVS